MSFWKQFFILLTFDRFCCLWIFVVDLWVYLMMIIWKPLRWFDSFPLLLLASPLLMYASLSSSSGCLDACPVMRLPLRASLCCLWMLACWVWLPCMLLYVWPLNACWYWVECYCVVVVSPVMKVFWGLDGFWFKVWQVLGYYRLWALVQGLTGFRLLPVLIFGSRFLFWQVGFWWGLDMLV